MATFPDIDYAEEGYGWEVSPDVIRTEFGSKNTRQRRLMKNRDDLFSVSLKIDSDDLSLFETFVGITLENGADTFTGPFFTSDVEQSGTLEILNGEYSVSYISPDYWNVSYQFYVKDRDLTDEGLIYELVNAFEGFCELYDIMEATDQAINDNNL